MMAAVPVRYQIRPWILWACIMVLAGCASRPYHAAELEAAGFLQRAVVQEQGGLVISTSVPTAEETITPVSYTHLTLPTMQ